MRRSDFSCGRMSSSSIERSFSIVWWRSSEKKVHLVANCRQPQPTVRPVGVGVEPADRSHFVTEPQHMASASGLRYATFASVGATQIYEKKPDPFLGMGQGPVAGPTSPSDSRVQMLKYATRTVGSKMLIRVTPFGRTLIVE